MRTYTAEKYRSLVEDTADPTLQYYMDEERSFLARIPGVDRRTLVDVGAGHGRVLGDLARLAENVIAVEINPDMFVGLEARAASLPNVTAVHADALGLDRILESERVTRPVFLILQNSIGTIEGDYRALLQVIRSQMLRFHGELVLSLLRQPVLRGWGIDMYRSIREMVGEPDLAATDTARGLFTTTSGYTSKWWTDAEIEAFKGLGIVEDELVADEFALLRLGIAGDASTP